MLWSITLYLFSVKKNKDVSLQSDSDADSSVEEIPPDSDDDDDDDDDDASSSAMSSSSGSSKPQRGSVFT